MNPFPTILSGITKITGKAWPWILRRLYPESRLRDLILLDISASGQGVTYYGSQQDVHCWLSFTNLSVFDMKVDRLKAHITVNGTSFTAAKDIPQIVKANTLSRFYLSGKSPVSERNVDFMKTAEKGEVVIEGYVECGIRSFPLHGRIPDMRNLEIH